MGNILEVNDSNFQGEVLETQGKVLVDFWAPWCGPCRMQTPILEKIMGSDEVNVKITKLNTDESPKIAGDYGIQSIPTIVIFKDGKEDSRSVGVQTEEALMERLK